MIYNLDYNNIKKRITSPIFLFLIANAMYSFSTWLISLLSPYFLEENTYKIFIYSYQSMLYVSSVATLGLVPTLLRFYKYDNTKYESYFLYCISIIFLCLFIFGLCPGNIISLFLHIDNYSHLNHFAFYLSSIATLLFVFNRALLTARERYFTLFYSIIAICICRILAMPLINLLNIEDDALILLIICVLPMTWEFFFYFSKIISIKFNFNANDFVEFISFAFMTSVIGILFVTSSRLYLLSLKSINSDIVPVLSYVYGMLGIITIFNTSFTSYFIGKLDGRNIEQINSYLTKFKTHIPHIIIFSATLAGGLYIFVYNVYPYNRGLVAIYAFISSLASSLTAFVGLITLLTKTFNLLKIQFLINLINLTAIYIFVNNIANIESIYNYIAITVFSLICETLVAYVVIKKFKKLKQDKNTNGKL